MIQCLICIVAPPAGVSFAIQKGRTALMPAFALLPDALWFAISLRLGPPLADGSINFRGEFAQGPPADRFIYINSGIRAGQSESRWERRAKLKLAGIPQSIVEAVIDRQDRAIQATVPGTASDGGPVCASVRSTAITWTATARNTWSASDRFCF